MSGIAMNKFQSIPVVLYHADNRSLVDGDTLIIIPVGCQVKSIYKAIVPPEFVTHLIIEEV